MVAISVGNTHPQRMIQIEAREKGHSPKKKKFVKRDIRLTFLGELSVLFVCVSTGPILLVSFVPYFGWGKQGSMLALMHDTGSHYTYCHSQQSWPDRHHLGRFNMSHVVVVSVQYCSPDEK